MGICNSREEEKLESGKKQDVKQFTIKIFNCMISVTKENLANIQISGIVLPLINGIKFEDNIYKIPEIKRGPLLAIIQSGMAQCDKSNKYIRVMKSEGAIVAK